VSLTRWSGDKWVFAETVEATAYLVQGKAKGKVVITR
jgi:hypothetical protein